MTMRNALLALSMLTLGACDQRPEADIVTRDAESTGIASTGAAPVVPPCECDPEAADPCDAGLQCVPINGGHACLARCSLLTACASACIYPFASGQGTGPAFCPDCVTCAPVDPKALICQ